MKNKVISIFNTKYKVKFVDRINNLQEGDSRYTMGLCDPSRYMIWVATKDIDGKDLDINVIKVTLIHEIIHAILSEGQYLDSYDNEPLVEWLAKCIKSMLDKKVFDI